MLDVARGVVGNAHVTIIGLHMHLGSPILSTEPYRSGVAKGLVLIEGLRNLMALIKGAPASACRTLVPAPLIVRNSTARPPGA